VPLPFLLLIHTDVIFTHCSYLPFQVFLLPFLPVVYFVVAFFSVAPLPDITAEWSSSTK